MIALPVYGSLSVFHAVASFSQWLYTLWPISSKSDNRIPAKEKTFSGWQKNTQGEGRFYNEEGATVWMSLRLAIAESRNKPWLHKTGMPLTLLLVQHFGSHACGSIQSFGYLSGESGYVISTGSQNQLFSAQCFHTWRNLLSLRLSCHHWICLKVAKGWVGSCWEKGVSR